MYTPAHFSESDQQRIRDIIDANGFATLISTVANEIHISHAPVQFDPVRNVLIGHLARANPQAASLKGGATLLTIFQGPHGYISPTWYVNENPKSPNVPTWNYAAVHVTGQVRRIDEAESIWAIVVALSAAYEGDKLYGQAIWNPQKMADHAPKLRALVGFEVTITDIQAKFKLSQNRAVADQESIIAHLTASEFAGDVALAALMSKNLKPG